MSGRAAVIGVVLVLHAALAGTALAAPQNDDFGAAIAITGPLFVHKTDTSGATTQTEEPQPSCAPIGRTVWYSLSVAEKTRVVARTVGSSFDTVLAVYTGTALANLAEVGCNDDATLESLQSRVKIVTEVGPTYYFQVGGFQGASGTLKFTAELNTVSVNDDFADALQVTSLPYEKSQNTTQATLEQGEPRPCGSIDRTVWYRFTPTSTVTVEADTFRSDFDTVLAVYTGSSLDTLTLVGCNDDTGFGLLSRIRFSASAGQTYSFQAGGFRGASGNLTFGVQGLVPPANDNFADRVLITALPFASQGQNTLLATLEPLEPQPSCAPIGRTVWFSLTPAETTILAADTFESNFDTVIAVYTGDSLDSLVPVGCNDDFVIGGPSRVSFLALAGKTYQLQVGGWVGGPVPEPDWGDLIFKLQAESLLPIPLPTP